MMSFCIGVLGKGKTGGQLIELLKERGTDFSVKVFDRNTPPTEQNLANVDGVISFFPGEAFLEAIPALLATKVPVVTGSTGFEWPNGREDFDQLLRKNNLCWIHGHNFSLGMNLVRQMIEVLSKSSKLFSDYEFSIHEVHHTKKLDAPSGTAIAWSEWLKLPANITSERTGDVVGDHQLTLRTPFEQIDLRHQAKDRKIFAAGALWAMEGLLTEKVKVQNGLHVFQDVAIQILLDENKS